MDHQQQHYTGKNTESKPKHHDWMDIKDHVRELRKNIALTLHYID